MDEIDEAFIAEHVYDACCGALSFDGFMNLDWNDLGEVTIVTSSGTFRGTFERLGDDA